LFKFWTLRFCAAPKVAGTTYDVHVELIGKRVVGVGDFAPARSL